nr:hypothetical protein [Tanacetum cinerariifolium]
MTNSGHSTVSYTSISSPERSWDIPDVDPYEEAVLQAIEQVAPPLSPTYLPDPIELDEHVPVYVSKPECSKYLELPADDIVAKDQPYANDTVPMSLSPGYIADSDPKEDLKEEDNVDYANEPEEEDHRRKILRRMRLLLHHHHLDFVGRGYLSIYSPPLLVPSPSPIPSSPLPPPVPVETHAPEQDVTAVLLMLPSTTCRSEVPEADMPPQKRLCFATPTIGFKVGQSSAVATARPPIDLYGFMDTTELVNLRISYEVQTYQRDGEEFLSQLRDAQRYRAGIRAEIVALRDRGTLLKDAYIELHEDLLRFEARNESLKDHNRSLVARIETIKTRMTKMEDQFQDTRDRAVSHKNIHVTRQGTSNNMTLEAI